jgi:hypothetical protein
MRRCCPPIYMNSCLAPWVFVRCPSIHSGSEATHDQCSTAPVSLTAYALTAIKASSRAITSPIVMCRYTRHIGGYCSDLMLWKS